MSGSTIEKGAVGATTRKKWFPPGPSYTTQTAEEELRRARSRDFCHSLVQAILMFCMFGALFVFDSLPAAFAIAAIDCIVILWFYGDENPFYGKKSVPAPSFSVAAIRAEREEGQYRILEGAPVEEWERIVAAPSVREVVMVDRVEDQGRYREVFNVKSLSKTWLYLVEEGGMLGGKHSKVTQLLELIPPISDIQRR